MDFARVARLGVNVIGIGRVVLPPLARLRHCPFAVTRGTSCAVCTPRPSTNSCRRAVVLVGRVSVQACLRLPCPRNADSNRPRWVRYWHCCSLVCQLFRYPTRCRCRWANPICGNADSEVVEASCSSCRGEARPRRNSCYRNWLVYDADIDHRPRLPREEVHWTRDARCRRPRRPRLGSPQRDDIPSGMPLRRCTCSPYSKRYPTDFSLPRLG